MLPVRSSRLGITSPKNVGTNVFTEGHKNPLDCNRSVARNRYICCCRCTLSLARSRSMLPFSPLLRGVCLSDQPTDSVNQGNGKATHILLVADPQILDDRSYPERSSLLRAVSRIFVDMNLRKAWRVAKRKRPHAIIFLGDMMDSGFADMNIMECVRDCLRSWLLLPLPLPTLTPLVPSQP
jgi:hypothetical protein